MGPKCFTGCNFNSTWIAIFFPKNNGLYVDWHDIVGEVDSPEPGEEGEGQSQPPQEVDLCGEGQPRSLPGVGEPYGDGGGGGGGGGGDR